MRIFNYNNSTHKKQKQLINKKRQGETHITFEFVGNLNFTPNLIAMYFLIKNLTPLYDQTLVLILCFLYFINIFNIRKY